MATLPGPVLLGILSLTHDRPVGQRTAVSIDKTVAGVVAGGVCRFRERI